MSAPLVHRGQALAAALLFATGGTAVKACAFDAWQVAGLRSGIAALAVFLLMPKWRRGYDRQVLLVGAAYGATLILFVLGNKLTTAANTIFLQGTAPFYLLLLGPWILRERIGGRDLAFGLVLAIGMGLFFVGAEPPTMTAPDPFAGNLCGVAAGLTWALTILGLRALGRRPDPPGIDRAGAAVVAGNVIVFLVCLAPALPFRTGGLPDVALVTYLGVFQIGLAYVALTRGVRGLSAFEVSLLLLAEPVASSLFAWAVHGERPGPWSLAGCLVILGATLAKTLIAPRRLQQ